MKSVCLASKSIYRLFVNIFGGADLQEPLLVSGIIYGLDALTSRPGTKLAFGAAAYSPRTVKTSAKLRPTYKSRTFCKIDVLESLRLAKS